MSGEAAAVEFKLDALCDVLDTDRTWLSATIIEVKETSVKIHYQGYSSKWDEWIDKTSDRIAPKGSKAVPRPGRRQWKTWFNTLFGFDEPRYDQVQSNFQVEVDADAKQPNSYLLRSKVNQKAYKVGHFETPSLGELRARVTDQKLAERFAGTLTLNIVIGDVSSYQAQPENQNATFQAASQFNCLEFVGPSVTPEDGVTGYVGDRTQGPCCSVAAGPATVFRNYFAPIVATPHGATVMADYKVPEHKDTHDNKVQLGQTGSCQINNLAEFNEAIGNSPNGRFFEVTGGYTLAQDSGLQEMNSVLRSMDAKTLDAVRAKLRIGVHSDVQVTSRNWGNESLVDANRIISQVFGSACSVSYSRNPGHLWGPIASLILQASYEACILSALENAARHGGQNGSKKVFLTAIGGGVFGNSMDWIADAIERACTKFGNIGLEVYIISYSNYVEQPLQKLYRKFPH